MATITTKHSEFTGHVGPVRFEDGKAETDNPAMLAHFKRDPERYEVTEKPKRRRGKAADKDKDGGKDGGKDKAPESDESGDESADQDGDGDKAGDESGEGADGKE